MLATLAAHSESEMPGLNLYIHIPFCAQKCHYCAFFSLAGQEKYIPVYCQVLEKEISLQAGMLKKHSIKTIYFGGGTPSLIPASLIKKILQKISSVCEIEDNTEISLEANPESITAEKITIYANAGINRLSIGVQAWQPHILAELNRPYQITDFERIIKLLQNSSINNYNLDLMFGLPNQTLDELRESLQRTIGCHPTHISCYSLELDNHSRFGRLAAAGKLSPSTSKLDRQMYQLTVRTLESAGYKQYEISNFAKPGFECQHNLNFWKNQSYLGLGAGAESYVDGISWQNRAHIGNYISELDSDRLPKTLITTSTESEQLIQTIVLGLRLNDGIDVEMINQKFYLNLALKCKNSLEKLNSADLLMVTPKKWQLTNRGKDVIDQVAASLASELI